MASQGKVGGQAAAAVILKQCAFIQDRRCRAAAPPPLKGRHAKEQCGPTDAIAIVPLCGPAAARAGDGTSWLTRKPGKISGHPRHLQG